MPPTPEAPSLYRLLDWDYGPTGEDKLRSLLEDGADPNQVEGALRETALHVAARRRREGAVRVLLDHGAAIDARNAGSKTAYAHAVRRGFGEIAELLRARGASTELSLADRFAVAVVSGALDEARRLLEQHPTIARTGNPEEDRLLADVAGRPRREPVVLLIAAGADLRAPALDDGTPLHQAAWFGQPENARLLLDAGAPLDVFDACHTSSPLGWAVHGSRYSGGADVRQEVYSALVAMLLEAGSSVHYPDQPESDAYIRRLLEDASPTIRGLIERHLGSAKE